MTWEFLNNYLHMTKKWSNIVQVVNIITLSKNVIFNMLKYTSNKPELIVTWTEKNGHQGDFESSDDKCNFGNVVQKISTYEENARRSVAGSSPFGRNQKKCRIGVPLVGMHNACGLPVVAWPECKDSKNLGNSIRNPRYRSRTQPKRRTSNQEEPEHSRTRKFATRSSLPKKRLLRKASFKNSRTNTLPAFKSLGLQMQKSRDFDVTRMSSKRKTLYAKDDGNEAVGVLTSLCLNPLARSRNGAYMMWWKFFFFCILAWRRWDIFIGKEKDTFLLSGEEFVEIIIWIESTISQVLLDFQN